MPKLSIGLFCRISTFEIKTKRSLGLYCKMLTLTRPLTIPNFKIEVGKYNFEIEIGKYHFEINDVDIPPPCKSNFGFYDQNDKQTSGADHGSLIFFPKVLTLNFVTNFCFKFIRPIFHRYSKDSEFPCSGVSLYDTT